MDENTNLECKKRTDLEMSWGKLWFRLGSFIACQALLLCLVGRADAQSLSQISSDARSGSPAPATNQKENRRNSNRNSDDDGGGNFIGELIGSMLFGSSNSRNSRSNLNSSPGSDINYEIYIADDPEFSFLDYPYANDQFGIGASDPARGKPNLSQLAFWYGTDFDDIDSWNTQYRLENQGFYGFEFQWSHLTEKLTGVPRDSLNLADFNVTTRIIESPHMIMRAGVGLNLLIDRFGTEADYNLTMSTDFFPVKPCVVSFEIDHGEVGSTHQTHLLSTVGFNYRRAEIMTGYEYRRIGLTEIHGPLLGMRLWW